VCRNVSDVYSKALSLHTCASEVCCSVHWNTLQHTATHYNTLQHTATHCNTHFARQTMTLGALFGIFKHTATHCNTLQRTATHCNTLATRYNTLQHTPCPVDKDPGGALRHIQTHCNRLQQTSTHTLPGGQGPWGHSSAHSPGPVKLMIPHTALATPLFVQNCPSRCVPPCVAVRVAVRYSVCWGVCCGVC